MKKTTTLLLLLLALSVNAQLKWPLPSAESKAGLRWWWPGSAVDEANLEWTLRQYADAGAGSVEITPIYGVQGNASHGIDFLSPEWMHQLGIVEREGAKDGILVDMNTGTGWPFGGPLVPLEEAALQRAETAYAGLQAENERTGHVLVQVREELQRREEARGLLEKQITTLKEEIERLKEELQSKTQDSDNLPPSPQKEIAKEPSAPNEESEKKPPSPRKKRKEKTPKASTSVATQLFFSFDD